MRLIDADKFTQKVLLMQKLNEERPLEKDSLENKEINNYDNGQRETFELIIAHLDRQPVAYDVDKVVEQFKKRRDDYVKNITLNSQSDNLYDEIKKEEEHYNGLIEIVKSGIQS